MLDNIILLLSLILLVHSDRGEFNMQHALTRFMFILFCLVSIGNYAHATKKVAVPGKAIFVYAPSPNCERI